MADRVTADPGRLDVLVNAGVGLDFGVSGVTPDFDKIQRILDTNFFGAYRLAIVLLPLLRAPTRGSSTCRARWEA